MAVITKFERFEKRTFRIQPTQVVGHFGTFGEGEQKVLQIDTHGSQTREKPQKQSQTLQLTRQSAFELWKLLGEEFKFSA